MLNIGCISITLFHLFPRSYLLLLFRPTFCLQLFFSLCKRVLCAEESEDILTWVTQRKANHTSFSTSYRILRRREVPVMENGFDKRTEDFLC